VLEGKGLELLKNKPNDLLVGLMGIFGWWEEVLRWVFKAEIPREDGGENDSSIEEQREGEWWVVNNRQ